MSVWYQSIHCFWSPAAYFVHYSHDAKDALPEGFFDDPKIDAKVKNHFSCPPYSPSSSSSLFTFIHLFLPTLHPHLPTLLHPPPPYSPSSTSSSLHSFVLISLLSFTLLPTLSSFLPTGTLFHPPPYSPSSSPSLLSFILLPTLLHPPPYSPSSSSSLLSFILLLPTLLHPPPPYTPSSSPSLHSFILLSLLSFILLSLLSFILLLITLLHPSPFLMMHTMTLTPTQVRKVEYRDPVQEQWEKFQKSIQREDEVREIS